MKDQIEALKLQVWKKAIGTSCIQFEDHFYRIIRDKMAKTVDFNQIQKPGFHWHTVRNFYNDQGTPRQVTLDVFAWYILGGREPKTFLFFQESLSNSQLTDKQLPKRGKWRVKVEVLVPIVLEIEDLLMEYFE